MGSWARGGPGLQRCKQLKLDYLLTARLENRRINAVRRGVGLLMQRLFKSSSKYCAFERLRWSVSRKRWGFRIRGRRLSALALHVSVGRSVMSSMWRVVVDRRRDPMHYRRGTVQCCCTMPPHAHLPVPALFARRRQRQ